MKIKEISIFERDVSEEDIFSQRLFRVYVLGLPRTGTSMMSGVVTKLGVNFHQTTDNKKNKEKREKLHAKKYGDGGYIMNDRFYEIGENRWDNLLHILATPYSGCKLIIPGFRRDIDLLKAAPSRVIMMWRDPEEIRQSQQASYKGGHLMSEEEVEDECARIRTLLVESHAFLEENDIPVLNFKYRDVLENPKDKVLKVAEFINSPNDISEAIKSIDPSKARFKKEVLTPCI